MRDARTSIVNDSPKTFDPERWKLGEGMLVIPIFAYPQQPGELLLVRSPMLDPQTSDGASSQR